jgi:hypothetical protein
MDIKLTLSSHEFYCCECGWFAQSNYSKHSYVLMALGLCWLENMPVPFLCWWSFTTWLMNFGPFNYSIVWTKWRRRRTDYYWHTIKYSGTIKARETCLTYRHGEHWSIFLVCQRCMLDHDILRYILFYDVIFLMIELYFVDIFLFFFCVFWSQTWTSFLFSGSQFTSGWS